MWKLLRLELTAAQLAWLNDYNTRVRAELSAVYAGTLAWRWDEWKVTRDEAMAFLLKETEPVAAAARL